MKSQKIERAIQLVISSFGDMKRAGLVGVPSYTHSLSVGLSLIKYGYDLEVALGGFCHDLVEDTEITSQMIERLFNARVAELVDACTLDPKLGDTPAGEDELHERVVRFAQNGDPDPLIIKCADSKDNLLTNAHLKKEYQVPAYNRGCNWLKAGRMHLTGHLVVDDLESTLRREAVRLRIPS